MGWPKLHRDSNHGQLRPPSYETYSPAKYSVDYLGVPAADYLLGLMEKLAEGWKVDFDADPAVGIQSQRIAVKPSQLIIGFSTGLGDGSKVGKSS